MLWASGEYPIEFQQKTSINRFNYLASFRNLRSSSIRTARYLKVLAAIPSIYLRDRLHHRFVNFNSHVGWFLIAQANTARTASTSLMTKLTYLSWHTISISSIYTSACTPGLTFSNEYSLAPCGFLSVCGPFKQLIASFCYTCGIWLSACKRS